MKKAIFGIMAILTIFAMVSCGGGGGGSSDYTITYNANGATGGTAPGKQPVAKGNSVTLAGQGDLVKTGYDFGGWNTQADGLGTALAAGATYTPTGNITLYAKWDLAAAPGTFNVTFNADGGAPGSQVVNVPDGGTIPSTSVTTPTKAGYTFNGWYTQQNGLGTAFLLGSTTVTGTLTVYAKWVEAEPIVEEITLANAWFAIFKFELPAGKTWADYDKLTVDYNLDDASLSVRSRILGNYTEAEIKTARLGVYKNADDEEFNIAVVSSWPGGRSNPWIMKNSYGSNTPATNLGLEDETWGTVEYENLRSDLFNGWNGNIGFENSNSKVPEESLEGRAPAPTATGPFYFAVGITTPNDNAGRQTPQKIKNVKLVGTGTEAVGTPLYYKLGDDLYRAYAGQLEEKGDDGLFTNTQGGKPEWKIISGADSIDPIIYDPATALAEVTVTYDANYPNDDTEPVIESVEILPGDRLPVPDPAPAAPTTAPAGDFNGWGFLGWFTEATDGVKRSNATTVYEDITVYAQWEPVNLTTITFNMGTGYTGDSKAGITITKGGGFTAAQVAIPSNGAVAGKRFGGWYLEDTAGGSFDPDDGTKLVTPNTKITTDTATLYAYWYTPATLTAFNEMTAEALGGARIDADGYIIMASGPFNAFISGSGNDSLISIKFPSGTTMTTGNIKITYDAVKQLVQPVKDTGQDDWTVDAALIWKKAYNSWDSTTSGNYVSWTLTGGSLSKALNTLDAAAGDNIGVSIQINGGDDANNSQKRAGFVYGIKITNIEFE